MALDDIMGAMSTQPLPGAEDKPPRSHRKPGPATARMPAAEESIGQVLRNDPREVLGNVVLAFFELALGWHLVQDDESFLLRLLGVALLVVGLLHVVSYVLKFCPAAFEREGWSRTRTRRAARLTLKYAWVAIFAAWIIVWIVSEIAEHS
jgi:hypothetical protein